MSTKTMPPLVKRVAFTLLLGCAFIVMASIFTPERSPAGSGGRGGLTIHPPHRENGVVVSANAHAGLRSLGVVEGEYYSIAVFATSAGPRYTIIDNETDEEVGTLLTVEQVQQLLPEIDVKTLDFSASGDMQPLMLAEPRE